MNFALKGLTIAFASMAMLGCNNLQPRSADNWIGYTETGKASYYANRHQFKKTASGELYNHNLKTAAHKKLPLGSKVKVTNVTNGNSVVVKINDRGPYARGRIIDLSKSAFSVIGNTSSGLISVRIEVIE